MVDANTVRQEVANRAQQMMNSTMEFAGRMDEETCCRFAAKFALAERQKVSDQFIEMLSTFGLYRPADKETGPWHRGECHPNCKACDMINAIRSQAATERGEPHAKS